MEKVPMDSMAGRHQLFNQNSVISAWSQGTRWQLPNYFWPFIEVNTPFVSKEFKPQGFWVCFAGHWVLQSNGNWLCCCRDLPKAWHFEKKTCLSFIWLGSDISYIFSVKSFPGSLYKQFLTDLADVSRTPGEVSDRRGSLWSVIVWACQVGFSTRVDIDSITGWWFQFFLIFTTGEMILFD